MAEAEPGAEVVGPPVGPVDRPAVEGGGEVVEVDVPPGQGGDEPLVGSRQRARERQDASVAVAAQLPPEPAVDVAEVLDHAQRLELGDRAVQDGAVALVVGVQPAQLDAPALDEVDVGVGEPRHELLGLGEGGPHALDRMVEPSLEAQDVLAVTSFEVAVGDVIGRGHGGSPSSR